MTFTGTFIAVIQALLVIATAPLVAGMIHKTHARLEGRQGASVLQPWRNLRKLLRKERIRPTTTSWVFQLTPIVALSTGIIIAGIVPMLTTQLGPDPVGDLFMVVYLFLLGTVFLALGGLDTATAFGGMGASREMIVSSLAEPAVLLSVFALSVSAGSSNLGAISAMGISEPSSVLTPGNLLAFAALAVVTLAETGRMPIDNPSTHLELTMIHEAMVLEYAGPDLAVIELAAQVKLTLFLGLLSSLFLPWGMATTTRPGDLALAAVAVALKIVVLANVIAVIEVFVAKLRLFRVPELLAGSFLLSTLAVSAAFFLP